MSDDRTQKIVDSVASVTRNGMGKMSTQELDLGWQKLERALADGKSPSVPILATTPRWWLRGFALAAVALMIGFATPRLVVVRSASPLHYVVEGASLGPGETIEAGPATPARLVFSDDSQIRVAPSTKVSVASLDAHGSRVVLADGELDVRVKHRKDTSWRFDAGPFTVQVRGTSFRLVFEAEHGRLFLQMYTGVVEARGSADDRVFTLRAGESLELFAGSPAQPSPALLPEAPAPSTAPADVPAVVPEPPAPRPSPAPTHRRIAPVERAGARVESGRWARLIGRGEFAAVVKDAQGRGIDATLAGASAADLISLADAARYTQRNDLARQALLGLRARFPGTARASEAAFFLGRLAEMPPATPSAALAWYEAYLAESSAGPYAGEALGREITLLMRSDRRRARKAAQTYLLRFPHGTHAELAKSLLESVPE